MANEDRANREKISLRSLAGPIIFDDSDRMTPGMVYDDEALAQQEIGNYARNHYTSGRRNYGRGEQAFSD